MERFSRYGILIARIMISMVFLLNALGVIDQAEAARELAARGAPSNLVPFLMLVGRSVELIGGLALALGIFPRVAALALIAFLVAATLVGHAFWLAAAGTPVFVGQLINFLKKPGDDGRSVVCRIYAESTRIDPQHLREARR
jgi:putative oxidoreductase